MLPTLAVDLPGHEGRNGYFMHTWSGRKFFPLDPRPDEISINDIAHALSNQCRFNGHTTKFYCPIPEERILTADLRWVAAGDLRVGDELFGFDEHPQELGPGGKKRRRFRPARILTTIPVKRRIIRLEMEDGSTVRASAEHPWLVATKASRNQAWISAGELALALKDGRKRYMHRFFTPWKTGTTRDDGWLAGMLDGEGYFSFTNRGGIQCGVSQRPGALLDELSRQLNRAGICYRASKTGKSDVISLQMLGGWRETATLLGYIRPQRLINKVTDGLNSGAFDKQLDGRGYPLQIVKAWDEGENWVSGLETSTRTYFCEGFGAHNSVAEHSWHCSYLVPPEFALEALLHDAAEAYIGDIIRPLKLIPDIKAVYGPIEEAVEQAIAQRFELVYPWPAWVKKADEMMVTAEMEQIIKSQHKGHLHDSSVIANRNVICMGPYVAQEIFLERFMELMTERWL